MALTKITSRILDSSGVTILGTIATGVWQGTPINQTYLVGQSGTNTGDETLARINALNVTELGTISSGVWQGSVIAEAYLQNQSGTNTGDQTNIPGNAGTVTNGVYTVGNQTIGGTKTFSSVGINGASDPSTTPSGTFRITNTSGSTPTQINMGVSTNTPYEGWIQSQHQTLSGFYYPLALQPSGGNVGIGTDLPGALLHINGTGDAVKITSTNAHAGGAQIDLLHYSESPADSDTVALINMGGLYYGGGTTQAYFSSIKTIATDSSARKGDLQFFTRDGNTFTNKLTIASTGAATFSSTGVFGNATLNGAHLVVRGVNGVPASSGTTTTAVFRVSSGTGLYNVLDFGTNEASDYSWIQSTRANSLGTYDYLAIQPNGGNLLVGTLTNSTYKLDVNGTARVSGAATFSGDVGIGTTPASGVRLDVRSNASATIGDFRNASTTGYGFYIAAGNTSSQYALKVANYANNDLVVVRGDGLLQAKYGISFPNQSSGSGTPTSGGEILDAYEEGTFTPVIVGSSSAGTATYTDQSGKYTKIGNCVSFRMDVIWSVHTGTGTLEITGLPFTNSQNYQSIGSVRFNQTGTASHYIGGGYIYQTQFELQQTPVGGGTPISFDVTAAGDIRVSGFYFA